MNLQITIHSEELAAELVARGEMLQAAILEAVGGLGEQLLERAQSKIAPVIRTEIGQGIFDSLTLQAAAYIDGVCQTSVFIPPSGAPSYIVAYVREFGGEKWYDIVPVRASVLAFEVPGGVMLGERGPIGLAGDMVFTKHVWHPPAKEQSYLRSSLEEMQGEIRDALYMAIAEVLAA